MQYSHLQQPVHKNHSPCTPRPGNSLAPQPQVAFTLSLLAFETRHFRFNKGNSCNGLGVRKPEQIGEAEHTTFPRKAAKAHSPRTLPRETAEQM